MLWLGVIKDHRKVVLFKDLISLASVTSFICWLDLVVWFNDVGVGLFGFC